MKPVLKKKNFNKKLPDVGDIIMSEKFAFGYYNDGNKKEVVSVDGETVSNPITTSIQEEERVRTAAKTGKVPPRTKTEDFGAYDPTRATSKFVVEEAEMTGGSRTIRDTYPDGWHIIARRLKNNGKYDPQGEVIEFYMSGEFAGIIEPKHVKIVGKMKKIVTFK